MSTTTSPDCWTITPSVARYGIFLVNAERYTGARCVLVQSWLSWVTEFTFLQCQCPHWKVVEHRHYWYCSSYLAYPTRSQTQEDVPDSTRVSSPGFTWSSAKGAPLEVVVKVPISNANLLISVASWLCQSRSSLPFADCERNSQTVQALWSLSRMPDHSRRAKVGTRSSCWWKLRRHLEGWSWRASYCHQSHANFWRFRRRQSSQGPLFLYRVGGLNVSALIGIFVWSSLVATTIPFESFTILRRVSLEWWTFSNLSHFAVDDKWECPSVLGTISTCGSSVSGA